MINSGLNGYSAGAELTAEWQATPTWRLRTGYTELHVGSTPQSGRLDRISSSIPAIVGMCRDSATAGETRPLTLQANGPVTNSL